MVWIHEEFLEHVSWIRVRPVSASQEGQGTTNPIGGSETIIALAGRLGVLLRIRNSGKHHGSKLMAKAQKTADQRRVLFRTEARESHVSMTDWGQKAQ